MTGRKPPIRPRKRNDQAEKPARRRWVQVGKQQMPLSYPKETE